MPTRAYLAAMWRVLTNAGAQCFLRVEQVATAVKDLETRDALSLGVDLGQETWALETQFPSMTQGAIAKAQSC